MEAIHRGKGRKYLKWAGDQEVEITEQVIIDVAGDLGIRFDTEQELAEFDEGLFITIQSFIEGVIPSNIVAALEDKGRQSGAELWRRIRKRLTIRGPIANHELRTSLQTLVLPAAETEMMTAIETWELKIARWETYAKKRFDNETKYGTLYDRQPQINGGAMTDMIRGATISTTTRTATSTHARRRRKERWIGWGKESSEAKRKEEAKEKEKERRGCKEK